MLTFVFGYFFSFFNSLDLDYVEIKIAFFIYATQKAEIPPAPPLNKRGELKFSVFAKRGIILLPPFVKRGSRGICLMLFANC